MPVSWNSYYLQSGIYIWKERNNLIFNGVLPSVASWKRNTKTDLSLHLIRLNEAHRPMVQSWILILCNLVLFCSFLFFFNFVFVCLCTYLFLLIYLPWRLSPLCSFRKKKENNATFYYSTENFNFLIFR